MASSSSPSNNIYNAEPVRLFTARVIGDGNAATTTDEEQQPIGWDRTSVELPNALPFTVDDIVQDWNATAPTTSRMATVIGVTSFRDESIRPMAVAVVETTPTRRRQGGASAGTTTLIQAKPMFCWNERRRNRYLVFAGTTIIILVIVLLMVMASMAVKNIILVVVAVIILAGPFLLF